MPPPLSDPPFAEDLVARRDALRRAEKSMVLSNGCFDLLHPGHLFFLREASSLADELWIGINSDASVKAIKGPARPVMNEAARAFALSSLACVAAVFVFPLPRLTEEIRLLRPDFYAKAGDYSLESLDPTERSALEEVGASIRFLPFLDGFSTTDLIHRIKDAF